MRFVALSTVAALAVAGCGGSGPDNHRQIPSPTPTPAPLTHERFSLSAAVPGAEFLGGVSVDPSNGHLWVLASGAGLAELDLEGHLLSLTKFEAEGLVDRGFVDLARLADGSFVLATSSEALHYKPDARALEVYFCLEPGWGLDYTVNKAGDVLSGSRETPRRFSEYWTLIRGRHPGERRGDGDGCPSCGAPMQLTMAGNCEHCGTHLTLGEFDWVLSKIEQDESYRG